MKKRLLAILIPTLWNTAHAVDTPSPRVVTLPDMVVTATRSEVDAADVMATVTSVTRAELDMRAPRDEADVFKDEPGVVMPRESRRHGATRVNIRGIEDNRVLMLVDGVRLPDYRNGGGPTNHTVNTPLPPDSEFLKRAEVLRGPASSLYGSDALGGVVGYVTLDAGDILVGDVRQAFRYAPSWHGADKQFAHAGFAALRGDDWDMLLGLSYRQGEEVDNQGKGPDIASVARALPNPQETEGKGLLFKFARRPAVGHTLSLTVEGKEQDTSTEVKRLSASLPKVTEMSANDHGSRLRGTLSWDHAAATDAYDRLGVKVFHQGAETENRTRQTRADTSATCSAASGTGNTCAVELDYDVDQSMSGISVQAVKGLTMAGKGHLLTYGLDLQRTETEERRDGRIRNLTTGATLTGLAGEVFPLRDFPPGHQDTLGLFVQDEIGLGRLTLLPGLRYDVVRLKAEPDAITTSIEGRPVGDSDDSAVSPKLAARWRLNDDTLLWGQWVRGFRAPNYEEVNGSFRNAVQRYAIVPNADLKPETSSGVEIGVKYAKGPLSGEFSLFENRYKDFIDSKVLTCPANPACLAGFTTYQSVNVDDARIQGMEARASWSFAPQWRVSGALAWARGDNETDDQPLNSIEPTRFNIALAYDTGPWGGEARINAAGKVKRADNTGFTGGATWFKPDAWQTVDLSAWWKPSKNTRLNVALNNVFDETYWLWGDVRLAGLTATDPSPEFYSQPGRNLSVSFQADF